MQFDLVDEIHKERQFWMVLKERNSDVVINLKKRHGRRPNEMASSGKCNIVKTIFLFGISLITTISPYSLQ